MICANATRIRTERVDEIVLHAIQDVLTDRCIALAVDQALQQLKAAQPETEARRLELEREIAALDARLARLVEAVVAGGPLESVVAQIKAEEERKKTLVAQIDRLAVGDLLGSVDTERITEQLWKRVADVKGLLGRQTPQVRQMLRKLLDGKILMEPIVIGGRGGYRISGSLNLGRLLPPEIFDALRLSPENNSRTVVAPTGNDTVCDVHVTGTVHRRSP